MPGIINSSRGAQDQELITPEKVQEGINVPPQLQDAYQRVVLAGMKVLFSKDTNSMVQEELAKPGPMGQKLGQGIAGLMLLLFQQSNKTMPPQLLIPAGSYLLAQAADYAKKTGQPVTNMDVAQGMEVMVDTLFSKFGVDPEKVMNAAGGAQQQQPAAPAAAQPAAPEQQGA